MEVKFRIFAGNKKTTQKRMNRRVFAPGCAMMLYKPELAAKLHAELTTLFGEMEIL